MDNYSLIVVRNGLICQIVYVNGGYKIVDYDKFECSEYFGRNAFKFDY